MIFTAEPVAGADNAKGTIVLLTGVYTDYQKQLSDPLRVLLNNAGYGLTIVLGRAVRGESFKKSKLNSSDVVYELVKSVDVQGIIVVAPAVCRDLNSDQILDFMEGFGDIPSICIGADVPGYDCLQLDNVGGMTACMNHLIARPENNNFMFIGGRRDNSDSLERETVFRNSLKAAGKQVDEELIIQCDFHGTNTYHAVAELLPKRPDVDVIVCVNDNSAIGAMYALKSLNLSVPGDIRICGFDDAIGSTSSRPALSSITQPFAIIAKITTDNLLRKIKGVAASPKVGTIRADFIQRESTLSSDAHSPRILVAEADVQLACKKLANAIITRIRLPRMRHSIEHHFLESALVDAATGNAEKFESFVTTFAATPKLSQHDIHWWQNLMVAIEDRAFRLPNSEYKDNLQHSLAGSLERIETTIQNWSDRRKYQLHRSRELNAKLLADISDAPSIERIVISVDNWLSSLKINRCFFAMYNEHSDKFNSTSKLVVNRVVGREPMPDEKQSFNTTELLPESLQNHLKMGLLLMLPIHSGGVQFGYMLIDPSDVGYFEYEFDAIGDRLGSAIRHLQQVEQMREHSDELERVNIELSMLANYDELTKLPNRLFFNHSLSQLIADSSTDGSEFAVLFIDLDGFKYVNDTFGHASGDLLLQVVAARLTSVMGKEAFISRLGGDEFTTIVHSRGNLLEEAKNISNELIDVIAKPLTLLQGVANVSASIGIAMYPAHASDRETLVRNADTAMYNAKGSGKSCYYVYTEDFDYELSRQIQQDKNIFNSFQNNEFHLVFQRIYNLHDSTVVGFEALQQWTPKNPSVEPMCSEELAQIAQRTGFIEQLDQSTLSESCAAIKRFHDAGITLPISVGVSTVQLHSAGFIAFVATCIRETDIKPRFLEIEISECSVTNDIEMSIQQIRRLKELGVCVAINEFGTDYSSLMHLKRLPVDTLKISKSLLHEIRSDWEENDPDVAILQAIISLGHAMNISVCAEGVENELQQKLLSGLGCQVGQGSYLSALAQQSELISQLACESIDKAA